MWARDKDLPSRSTTWRLVASAVDSFQGLSRQTVSVKRKPKKQTVNSQLLSHDWRRVASLESLDQLGVRNLVCREVGK